MAKKFGKFLAFSVIAGASAAGIYYYLKKKKEDPLSDCDDDDDFDDFNEDLDDDLDDPIPVSPKNRSYVSLDLENAKEIISEKVIETIDKAKEKIEDFNVSDKLDRAKEMIEGLTGSDTYTTVMGDDSSESEKPDDAGQSDISEETDNADPSDVSDESDAAEHSSVTDKPDHVTSATASQGDREVIMGFENVEEFFDDSDEDE